MSVQVERPVVRPAPNEAANAVPPEATTRFVVRPASRLRLLNVAELWHYRELFYFFAWRDFKVRYKQTAIGIVWVLLQPLVTMLVFTAIFSGIANISTEGIPYPLFSFCALVPWQLFANSLTQTSQSLVAEQRLITKVYFPRIIIPASSIMSSLVDFLFSFSLLLVMLGYYYCLGQYTPAPVWRLLTIPLFVLFALLAAFSVGLWMGTLNVEYRDFRYIVPFASQIWLFLTPVAYPSSKVPERWKVLFALNPMTGVVEGFRWSLLPTEQPPPLYLLLISIGSIGFLLITGLFYFDRKEKTFADMI